MTVGLHGARRCRRGDDRGVNHIPATWRYALKRAPRSELVRAVLELAAGRRLRLRGGILAADVAGPGPAGAAPVRCHLPP